MILKEITQAGFVYLLLFGLFFSACDGAGEYQFSDWDQDGNNLLDENEFNRAYAQTAYQEGWDTNRNKDIDEDEWESGVANYWVAYDIGEYGAFSSWDSDVNGNLSENEFRERIFEFYDKDEDQFLNDEEYNNWYSDFNK